ncbi:TLR adapter interacting with SLC15A4 on the lysosome [Puntigrus tetrazona]|uniref:TLR adapter interacting with SLC15A4 on the lysosome n=1 Tax=Puntigrus tetrazona TaxID=1606681 RepID=UPI001C8A8B66|nr:TLR adapter interacting with SLC15A4 on the lysosome [Puntigrus tetrazona]
MLGEAFLYVLNCTEDITNHDRHAHTHSATPTTHPDPCTTSTAARSPLTSRTVRAGRPERLEKPGPCRASAPSNAVPILSCSREDHLGMMLYCSWCCPSFCKDYPDLRIAGDRLEHYSPHNPDLINPPDTGPLLQSQDLSSMEPSLKAEQSTEAVAQQDEEYLVMESVQGPGWERRLTNSMLNGYLEVQMMEVYYQHLQNMACCGSSLLSTDVMPALGPTSLTLAKEQTASHQEALDSSSNNVVHYLSTCSAPATSHFSSPVLRISEAE